MPKKRVKPTSLQNLLDTTAPDSPGETVLISGRVSLTERDWLDSLPGGRSYHVRQAIKFYKEHYKE